MHDIYMILNENTDGLIIIYFIILSNVLMKFVKISSAEAFHSDKA